MGREARAPYPQRGLLPLIESRILIVDDDATQAEMLRRVLALEGFAAEAVYSPQDALKEVALRVPDAIISDFRMGDMTGLDLYLEIKKSHPDILFILATGYGSMETAVKAMQAGVHDFLSKPLDANELVVKLQKALKVGHLRVENTKLRETIEGLNEKTAIIAVSSSMKDVLARVERIAPSTATVLIQGESGTGKELIARSLHSGSERASGPYVKVNCAAIPDNLLEDELFGHVPGAFTGAVNSRAGKFASAEGGSIFLDEIGEMPLHLQSKILRALQEKEFEPVGGEVTLRADVRVIAATNRDLAEMVRDGSFREDLFYRLNVVPVSLPPLRARMDDVMPLARHFLARYNELNGRDLGELSGEVEARLLDYSWPGNVRELENCIERAVILARADQLTPEDISYTGEDRGSGIDNILQELLTTDLSLDELERHLILKAIDSQGGNVSQTARTLGMTRRSLQYRLEKIRGEMSEGNE